MMLYAHSLPDRPVAEWEMLADHLQAVGNRANEFAQVFGCGALASVAGRLHDIGKCSQAYQKYIGTARVGEERTRGPDHSTAGAKEAIKAYPGSLGRMLAYAVAGHHAGLSDADKLDARLTEKVLEDYSGWEIECGSLPPQEKLLPEHKFLSSSAPGFTQAFMARMLFSCLVDADFLETERFYAEANNEKVERGDHIELSVLRARLRTYMTEMQARAGDTPVNALRARVLDYAIQRATLEPGLFTLTVPTGGGKTLASLSFALEHAVRHGLRRVIYIVPFTSIIEQTAVNFRDALKTNDDILEHHASFDWEQAKNVESADSEGPDGLSKLRRAAENWDVPIVVTTAVQFFESLFAKRTSRCRKLHNIAKSVIVLDEAQTIPVGLLRPCMAVLDELTHNYGASAVLCTATQPALRKCDEALIDKKDKNFGFDIGPDRELAPDPEQLYTALKRVKVEHRSDVTTDAEIAARFAERPQMLCIVNSRRHARALFDAIRDQPGATHLSTLMCPRHRRIVLENVRTRLKDRAPVRLVATSLIEAGVDVDFPEVWRAAAGLSSIAQAAGRCNREGKLDGLGRTVVFMPADDKPPRELEAFWQATRPVLRSHGDDLLGLDAVHAYFKELYWQKGEEALDATKVGERRGILPAIGERKDDFKFPFATIAEAFRFIDDVMEPVIVPWKASEADNEAEVLLRKIASMDRPLASDLRRLQQYTVSLPKNVWREWLAAGVLQRVNPALGDGLLHFKDLAHYGMETGVNVFNSDMRSPEMNVL